MVYAADQITSGGMEVLTWHKDQSYRGPAGPKKKQVQPTWQKAAAGQEAQVATRLSHVV